MFKYHREDNLFFKPPTGYPFLSSALRCLEENNLLRGNIVFFFKCCFLKNLKQLSSKGSVISSGKNMVAFKC